MNLKRIEKILKSEKTIIVIKENGCQWFGNGVAFYPVYNLPDLTQDNVFTMFDIPEEKRDKYYFKYEKCPESISLEDYDEQEELLMRGQISFIYKGKHIEPLRGNRGNVYINQKYLKPFEARIDGYDLYLRKKREEFYVAVKTGLTIIGVVAVEKIGQEFINEVKNTLE